MSQFGLGGSGSQTTDHHLKPLHVSDIEAAARRLDGFAVHTPLLESHLLSDRLGGRLLVKAEPLQRTGSFKFRGAFNHLSCLSSEERRRCGTPGVIAYSSGNHAQGVAEAARLLKVPAVIVMPADAPAIKIAGTRDRGADVVTYDRQTESREAIAERLTAERGAVLVKPYDDPLVIAGQGTVGWELASQAREMGVHLDAVLVPCGGGGLTAGIALALAELSPSTAVIAVEPEGFDDTTRSLAGGCRVAVEPGGHSFCDALLAPEPGVLTFAINARLVDSGRSVDDRRTAAAMAAAFEHFKLVLEPGGAVALAAALFGACDIRGQTVAGVCSGGNVDRSVFARALAASRQAEDQPTVKDGVPGV